MVNGYEKVIKIPVNIIRHNSRPDAFTIIFVLKCQKRAAVNNTIIKPMIARVMNTIRGVFSFKLIERYGKVLQVFSWIVSVSLHAVHVSFIETWFTGQGTQDRQHSLVNTFESGDFIFPGGQGKLQLNPIVSFKISEMFS